MDATRKDLKQLYNQTKSSAKKRNIAFELTMVDFNQMSFPITCPVLGMPLTFNTGRAKYNSYSIDRIDSKLGYAFDNIVIVSNRANVLKSDATLTELVAIADYYQSILGAVNKH